MGAVSVFDVLLPLNKSGLCYGGEGEGAGEMAGLSVVTAGGIFNEQLHHTFLPKLSLGVPQVVPSPIYSPLLLPRANKTLYRE